MPLQAKKPKTRMSPPKAESGTECPGIAEPEPFFPFPKRPIRGPMRTQPTRAQTAEETNRAVIRLSLILYAIDA